MVADLHKTHTLSTETRTVEQRKCWSVIFDTNGNAPADATVASFATEELAKEACKLWRAMKDDDAVVIITINGVSYFGLPSFDVEGYDFDTRYKVQEDWQEDKDIFTSLAQLRTLCDCEVATGEPDGIVLADEEPEGAE